MEEEVPTEPDEDEEDNVIDAGWRTLTAAEFHQIWPDHLLLFIAMKRYIKAANMKQQIDGN